MDNNQGWFDVFSLVTYAAMSLCTYGAVKKGFRHHKKGPPSQRLYGVMGQLFVLFLFCFVMWLVESYAHYRTPYYYYAFQADGTGGMVGFRDMAPRAADWFFAGLGVSKPVPNVAVEYVQSLDARYGRIPVTVVLFEAVLAYSAMWTSRLMGGRVWTRPLLAGLVLVNVDLMLDPIVARVHLCSPAVSSSSAVCQFLPGTGIGFWHWVLPPDLFARWYEVPAFNFVAWWAAPVILVSLVSLWVEGVVPSFERCHGIFVEDRPPRFSVTNELLAYGLYVVAAAVVLALPKDNHLHRWPQAALAVLAIVLIVFGVVSRIRKMKLALSSTVADLVAYLVFIAGAIGFVLLASPNFTTNHMVQAGTVIGVTVISLVAFVSQFRTYRTHDRIDATLTMPLAAALLVPAVAGIVDGQLIQVPSLMVVVPISLIMGLWLAFLPFRKAIDAFAARLRDLDRLVRLHYFGFTAMMVLFGAALAFPQPPTTLGLTLVAGLIGAAASFHVFAYVLNDLVDLPLDKTVPRRLLDPLASGRVNEETAAGIVGSATLSAITSTLFVTGFEISAGVKAIGYAILAGAFLLMTVYNVWGKKIAWPVVTDAIEGVSWALLSLYGMFIAGVQNNADVMTTLGQNRYAAVALFSCGFLFIFLINGIHGGLRDAKTDLYLKKNTTALRLGATPNPDGSTRSTLKIQIFAFTVQTTLFLILFSFVALDSRWQLSKPVMFAILGALLGLNTWCLFEVVRTDSPRRTWWISAHLVSLLLPGLFVFMFNECPAPVFKWSVGVLFVLPLLLQEEIVEWIISTAYGPAKASAVSSVPGSPSGGPTPPAPGGDGPPSDPTPNSEVTGVRSSESLRATGTKGP